MLKKLFRRHKTKAKKTAEPEIKELITFIGRGLVGKTTILHRLRTGEFYDDSARTMGLNVEAFEYRNVAFQAFDLGGQDTFQELWPDYVRLSKAVVFVIDCSKPEDFEECKKIFYQILPHIPDKSVLLIAANKADISGVDPYVLLLKNFDLYDIQQKGKFRALNVFHMSAKSGANFYQAFDWLIETLTGEFILPKISVHNICIYKTDSGLLVGSSAPMTGATHYDPSLLTSMFSAVNTFAQASLGAGVREILMKRGDQVGIDEVTEDYKLVRVEESDFSVILIVDESDSMRKSVKIGKDLVLWTRMKIPDAELQFDLIDEAEIHTYLQMKFPDDFGQVSA